MTFLTSKTNARPEEIHVQFFEFSPGQSFAKVFTVKEGLDLDLGLVSRGQSPLSFLNFPSQFLDGPIVLPDVLAGLFLVKLHEVVHDPLVEIFTSEMGVPCEKMSVN